MYDRPAIVPLLGLALSRSCGATSMVSACCGDALPPAFLDA